MAILSIIMVLALENNQNHQPLFHDGFVDIDESAIDSVFVGDLNTPRRRFLASMLRLFLGHLRSLGLESYEVWINGSFATKNPAPIDVDIVCFIDRQVIANIPDKQLEELKYLASEEGRAYVRERWSCDYYQCPFDSFEDRNYWKETFSSDEYGSTKGIVRIKQ